MKLARAYVRVLLQHTLPIAPHPLPPPREGAGDARFQRYSKLPRIKSALRCVRVAFMFRCSMG